MIIVTPGPDWASIMTAIGTVLVAIAAVGIALWSDRRTGVRIAAEQARHDKETADERVLAAKRLADQQAHSDKQLADERAHSAAQLQEERQLAQDREQLAEAYLVEVTEARMTPEAYGSQITSDPDTPIECPVAIVINHGRYTITRLEAQICMNGNSLTSYGKTEHFTSRWRLLAPMTAGLSGEGRDIYLSTLTPADIGMRYTHDAVAVRHLLGSYPIVRWQDRWGTFWEHRQGVVRKIAEGEQWKA